MGLVDKAIGEAINLGSGKEHRVVDMAGLVNRLSGNEAGIKFTERRDWDVKTRLLSSIDKANRILDYSPKVDFEEGLMRVHTWFSDNWERINRSAEF